MRIFQNYGIPAAYRERLTRLTDGLRSFAAQRDAFLADRYGASHLLKPVLTGDAGAFFTNGNDERLQRAWAEEQGLPTHATLDDILQAQIEHHRSEVFYNVDPVRYGDDFLSRLPGCVRRTIAWRAAPSGSARFLRHDIIVNNFPSLLADYRARGVRAEYFYPAHDPEMDAYAGNGDRPIDILFVGGYSRHHGRRAEMLRRVAGLSDQYRVVFCLDVSRFTRLAESPLGLVGPLRQLRRPAEIRAASALPVFGRDLYELLGSAKIVINGAIDMAGLDRGNMRVWEAMGCGAALVSDAGTYPEGMVDGETMLTYGDGQGAIGAIHELLRGDATRSRLVSQAFAMISTRYSKDAQWTAFQRLAQ
jgi:glycosyltransferase involved in cell wall biosynthesis